MWRIGHTHRDAAPCNAAVLQKAKSHHGDHGAAKPQPKNLTGEIAEIAVTAMTSKLREANLLAEAAQKKC
jgi:hypothetical protein